MTEAHINGYRIPITFLHILGISSTIFRVWQRWRGGKIGNDDRWVIGAAALDVLYCVSFWLRSQEAAYAPDRVLRMYVILNWFTNFFGTTIIWVIRMSILASIYRYVYSKWFLRKQVIFSSVLFMFMWLGLLGEKSWVCAHDTSWHDLPSVQCGVMGRPIPETELVFAFISDSILCAIPIQMRKGTKLPVNARRLITCLLAMASLIALSNLFHIIILFGSDRWGRKILVSVSSHIETTVSLMSCNLLVIIPFIYQRCSSKRRKSNLRLTPTSLVPPMSLSPSRALPQSTLAPATDYWGAAAPTLSTIQPRFSECSTSTSESIISSDLEFQYQPYGGDSEAEEDDISISISMPASPPECYHSGPRNWKEERR